MEEVSGLTYTENFIPRDEADKLFEELKDSIDWDESMQGRKTASFGMPYNYRQMTYSETKLPEWSLPLVALVAKKVGWTPNNCLLNCYVDGTCGIGWHGDHTEPFEENTGVAVITLGCPRKVCFRKVEDKAQIVSVASSSGSLLTMTNAMQEVWQHAILRGEADDAEGRISLTFRRLKEGLKTE